MFIPNKTYHAIKVGVLSVIATLLLVIVVESVLYFKLVNDTNGKITTLTTQLDSLTNSSQSFDKVSLNKHRNTQTQITDAVTSISKLNSSVESNAALIQILIANECAVRPYYMDKRLLDMCSE